MNFISQIHTDIGIKKEVNQDSALILEAKTDYDNVFFAVLCDGMGGLANGELASATVIRAFSEWFKTKFPNMLYGGFDSKTLEKAWQDILFSQNVRIMEYSRTKGFNMGTTVVTLLITGGSYYVMNVGDSRAYVHDGNTLTQITVDQTFVNREIKRGNMTPEQAKTDPRRNVLLQCVGASQFIEPDLFIGNAMKNSLFFLCSDGFRHEVSYDELKDAFNPQRITDEKSLKSIEKSLVELNMQRNENDNITVLGVKLV